MTAALPDLIEIVDDQDRLIAADTVDGHRVFELRWGDHPDAPELIHLALPDRRWLVVHTDQVDHPILGRCDVILGPFKTPIQALDDPRLSGEPLTVGRALCWRAPDHIPPLERPAAMPGGGGAAMLDLQARLAIRAGVNALRYRGPYPTAALFDALHGSFELTRSHEQPARALARFTEGVELSAFEGRDQEPEVDWTPRPARWRWPAEEICLMGHERIERAWVQGPAYSALAAGARRLRFDGDQTVATLEIGGVIYGRAATFSSDGSVLEGPSPLPPVESPLVGQSLPAGFRQALARALPPRAPALMAPALTRVLETIELKWGDPGADVCRADAGTVVLHAALAERLRGHPPGEVLDTLARIIEPVAWRLAQRAMGQVRLEFRS